MYVLLHNHVFNTLWAGMIKQGDLGYKILEIWLLCVHMYVYISLIWKYKVAPRTLYLTSLFKKKRAITGFVGLGQRFFIIIIYGIFLFIDSVILQEVSLIRNFHPFII